MTDGALIWMARLRSDPWLVGLWWLQHLLAASALLVCGAWIVRRLGLPDWWMGWALLPSLMLLWSACYLPESFAGRGRLILRPEAVVWQPEGRDSQLADDYRWLWCSQWLIGIEWRGAGGRRQAQWLTAWRTGRQAWRRLQVLMRLQHCRGSRRVSS